MRRGRLDRVGRHAERAGDVVGRAQRQHGQDRAGRHRGAGGRADRAVAAGGDRPAAGRRLAQQRGAAASASATSTSATISIPPVSSACRAAPRSSADPASPLVTSTARRGTATSSVGRVDAVHRRRRARAARAGPPSSPAAAPKLAPDRDVARVVHAGVHARVGDGAGQRQHDRSGRRQRARHPGRERERRRGVARTGTRTCAAAAAAAGRCRAGRRAGRSRCHRNFSGPLTSVAASPMPSRPPAAAERCRRSPVAVSTPASPTHSIDRLAAVLAEVITRFGRRGAVRGRARRAAAGRGGRAGG